MSDLRRRDVITLLGGMAFARPCAVWAQQPAIPVVGFLHPGSLAMNRYNVAGFRQGLADAGSSRAATSRSNSAGRIIN
ncbi:MAG TPA: hypothetical protein VI010_01060 [Xanthobacteraceae bacterium]